MTLRRIGLAVMYVSLIVLCAVALIALYELLTPGMTPVPHLGLGQS